MNILKRLRPRAFAFGCLLIVLVFGAAALSRAPAPPAAFAQATLPEAALTPLQSSRFASSSLEDFVHSASIAPLPEGGLIAVWFAGTREGAADVQIRTARFDPQAGEWLPEQVLATREGTRQAVRKHIRKLGNPVIARSPEGRLWLFYVSVSVGGWAGSAINAMYSDDVGQHWSAPRQLVTSPFLNVSTLVRGAPLFHQDGSIGLPIYHEFMGKFAEYLYLSRDGAVLDKFRISKGKHSLQPTVVALGERRAVALLRYAGETHHRVLASRSEDAGRSWSVPTPLEPSNPNSSLAAVGRPDGSLLVALNDLEDGRFRLTLYATDPQMGSWRWLGELDESPDPWGEPLAPGAFQEVLRQKFRGASGERLRHLEAQVLERGRQRMCTAQGCGFEYEYPYFIRAQDGRYHLVYSWNDMFIKHLSFNEAWLEARE